MKITNKQFAEIYIKDLPASEILALLSVIKTLLVRHKVEVVRRMDSGSGQIADLQAFVRLLDEKGKLNRADISSLIRIVSTRLGADTKQFILTGKISNMADQIQEALPANAALDLQPTNDL